MDKTNTVVVGGNNVQGDITSCDIKKIDTKHNVSGVMSPVDNVTYVTYNSCTKQILTTYSVPELRGEFAITVVIGLALFFFILVTAVESLFGNRY